MENHICNYGVMASGKSTVAEALKKIRQMHPSCGDILGG